MNNSTSADLAEQAVTVARPLAHWSAAIEVAIQAGDPQRAVALAQAVLKRLPRHLPTYQRLLQAAWQLKRWDEGEDWSRRLLRADPGNALAWQMLAMAAEQRGKRAQAHATWQRAFEAAPYEPEIRAGLSRTTLRMTEDATRPDQALMLNSACLAALYLRCQRWERAAPLFRRLLQADARRVDFQLGLLLSLWQQQQRVEGYQLARYLVRQQPHLLLAWAVLAALGDVNDQALARNPIETMDPDGEFVRQRVGGTYERRFVELRTSAREAALLDA